VQCTDLVAEGLRAEQMEVAWSKVGAILRMLEDFPLFLLHDERPHTANKTNETLRNFKWEVSSILRIAPTLLQVSSSCSALLNIIFLLNIFPTMKL
jgi:hypothetical protein